MTPGLTNSGGDAAASPGTLAPDTRRGAICSLEAGNNTVARSAPPESASKTISGTYSQIPTTAGGRHVAQWTSMSGKGGAGEGVTVPVDPAPVIRLSIPEFSFVARLYLTDPLSRGGERQGEKIGLTCRRRRHREIGVRSTGSQPAVGQRLPTYSHRRGGISAMKVGVRAVSSSRPRADARRPSFHDPVHHVTDRLEAHPAPPEYRRAPSLPGTGAASVRANRAPVFDHEHGARRWTRSGLWRANR